MTLFADFNPNVSVPFSRVRQLFEDSALQAGVVGATDFKVAQRGAGANMSVDVPVGQAWVEVTTGTRNGVAHIVNDATANVAVSASNATNPRVDQLVLQYNDSSIPTGSGDVPTLSVLAGTATAGATLDNRTGAAALGNDRLRLADILVPAASTSVTTANIRDRRPWARGAYRFITRNSANYTLAASVLALVDATNLQPRIECSGAPMRARLTGSAAHSTAGQIIGLTVFLDGTAGTNVLGAGASLTQTQELATAAQVFTVVWDFVPAAGSHLIAPAWSSSAATATLSASATVPLQFSVEEIVRLNADNS